MAKKKQSLNEYLDNLRQQVVEDKKFCEGCFSRDGVTTITVKEHLYRGWRFITDPPGSDSVIITTTNGTVEKEEIKHFVKLPCHFCGKIGRLSLSSVAARLYDTDRGQGLRDFTLMKDTEAGPNNEVLETKYNALKGGDFDLMSKDVYESYIKEVLET